MNIFSLLSAFACSFSVFLAFQALKKRELQNINLLFGITSLLIAIWSFTMIYRFSVSDLLWMKRLHYISEICTILVSSVQLHFILELSGQFTRKNTLLRTLLVYLPGMISIILFVLYYNDFILYKWGAWGWEIVADNSSIIGPIIGILVAGTSVLSFIIVLRWFIKSPKNEKTKKLAFIFLIFISLSFLPALVVWLITEMYQILSFPKMIHIFSLFWLSGIWYVMSKYQFMNYHPDIILNELMQNSRELMFIHDSQFNIIMANKKSLDLLQKPGTTIPGTSLISFVTENEDTIKNIRDLVKEKYSFNLNTSLQGSSEMIPVYWLGTPFASQGWTEDLYLSIIHDKRELEQMAYDMQKDNSLALKLSEIEYRTTLDAISDYLVVSDRHHNIVLYNQALGRYYGEKHKGELLGRNLFDAITLLDKHLIPDYETIFQSGIPSGSQEHHVIKGSDQLFEVQRIPIEDQGAVHYVVTIFHNLRKQMKADEIQLRNEKMESLAILASGITHDFNNILTGIMGNISIAHYKSSDPEVKAILKRAEEASYRAKNLTAHLTTFSSGGSLNKKTSSLTQFLSETARFILSGSNIKIRTDFHHKSDKVEIDESQLQRVFHNLIINARDAMPQGGVLTLSSHNVTVSQHELKMNLKPGSYVVLQIQDEGTGIETEMLTKIFDPFFSTKTSGTGLGLSTSFSIIKNHGGMIDVDSVQGSGTTFSIYLPLSEAESHELTEEVDWQIQARGKILVMDDEEVVLYTTREILEYLGYTVILCSNGDSALEKYQEAFEKKEAFDVVILDLTVPGARGGVDIIQDLLQINPDLKAILTCGYLENESADKYMKMGFKSIITKPFDVAKLAHAVMKVIKDKPETRSSRS